MNRPRIPDAPLPSDRPESVKKDSAERAQRREKAQKEIKQQLQTLMKDMRAQATERDGKNSKELAERIQKQQREVIATLALLIDPATGRLPESLEKEIAAEFNDKESQDFISELLNGAENRLGTDAENLGREIDGRAPTTRAGHLFGRLEGRLSEIVDGFIRDRGVFTMISERTGIPEEAIAKQFSQVQPFLMNAFRNLIAGVAENFKIVPGAQEFAVRTRVEGSWPALLKLKMQNPSIAKAVAARGGPDRVKELYINAMVGHATNRTLSEQARQPFNEPLPTIESVLGLPVPGAAPGTTPAPAVTEQEAKKKEVAADAPRPLGAAAETIQDMQMSYVNGEFRVQKGGDTYKAAAKHGNDAATVAEVTPVRAGTAPVESLTVKTRQGTTDLTKTFGAVAIKNALDSNAKRVTVDNVTLEFTRA